MRSKLPDVGTTIFTVMSRRARELEALNLGQGFPDYDIDPRLTELVTAAMAGGHNQYAPMEGLPVLRERIAAKLASSYGRQVDPESEITVTLGGTEAIYSAIQACLGAGEEAIAFDRPTIPMTPRCVSPADAASACRSRSLTFATTGSGCVRR